MNPEQEYMVTLTRLQLPEGSTTERLTLAISSPLSQRQFIHNDRTVKRNRVNFYRETLFVDSVSAGLFFEIYDIADNSEPLLLKVFRYSAEELSSVNRHAAMFHTQVGGFELVWECCVFSAQDSDLYYETDRDYTELRDDIGSQEDNQMSDVYLESHSNLENTEEECRDTKEHLKKTNSTEDTGFAKTAEERNWRLEEDFHIQERDQGEKKLKKIESEAGKEQRKKRTHIKSHIYSQMITEISELFSGRRM